MATRNKRPGRPSLPEAEKQAIRDNIIQIARDLFVNSGYENTSMRKIAAKAGFAPTKIYYYFSNKKAILNHFWQDIAKDLWAHCRPPDSVMQKDAVEVIRYLMLQNVTYWLQNPQSYQLGLATHGSISDEDSNFYGASGNQEYALLMQNLVKRCIEQGAFCLKCEQIASKIIEVSVYGIYSACYNKPYICEVERDTMVNQAIENTLRGLTQPQLSPA